MNGILNVDKPAGMTSHDVVARIRRLARIKAVGHTGTLDPDATGVLLVCLGMATRLAEFFANEGKAYAAVLRLGRTTTTEDASGAVLAEIDASAVSRTALEQVLLHFVGQVAQVPPMVSAVHYEGHRLYELAREGRTVERAPRTIQIDRITLTDFEPGPAALARLDVVCGKGTYIRTLCADIGAALGVGGSMESLRRTAVGRFRAEDAIALDRLNPGNIAASLTSPSAALAAFPALVARPVEQEEIRHGRALTTSLSDGVVARVIDDSDNLLALARASGGTLRPFKVFSS